MQPDQLNGKCYKAGYRVKGEIDDIHGDPWEHGLLGTQTTENQGRRNYPTKTLRIDFFMIQNYILKNS